MRIYNKFSSSILLGLGLLASVVTLTGCNKFLDQAPDDRTQLNDIETIKELITSGYPDRSYTQMFEMRSDNATDKGMRAWDDTREDREVYAYQEVISSIYQDTPSGYWSSLYNCIAVVNQALKSIDELTDLSPKERKETLEARGEALMIRAYSAYMLAQTFAIPYDPATAKTALGIPYPTEPEDVILKEYKRGNLQETYDNIVKDFEEGIKLVSSNYSNPKYHFNIVSSSAFGTRLYRTLGDWDKVIKYAKDVLGDNPAMKIRDVASYRPLPYAEKQKKYSLPTEDCNLMLNVVTSWWNRKMANSRYGLTPDITDKVNTAKNFLLISPDLQIFGGDLYANLAKVHEYFKVTNVQSGTGQGYVAYILFTGEEVLFNMGEAYAMKGDYEKANEALQIFVSKWFNNYSPTNEKYKVTMKKITDFYAEDDTAFKPFYTMDPTQTAYAKAFAYMRRVAFLQEGMRWMDIRHYNLPVEHKLVSQNDTKIDFITMNAGDPRYAFQLPSNVLGYNLEKNPGYEASKPLE